MFNSQHHIQLSAIRLHLLDVCKEQNVVPCRVSALDLLRANGAARLRRFAASSANRAVGNR